MKYIIFQWDKHSESRDLTQWKVFLAATKQLYEWFSPSVRLSARLPQLFHYVPIILSSWNYYNWQKRGPCKRSGQRLKNKVTEVKIQLSVSGP